MLKCFFLFLQLAFATEPSQKILYIDVRIEIEKNLSWTEIGAQDEKVFIDTIKSSWLSWAQNHFKKFDKILVESPPTDSKDLHQFTNVLRWSSIISKNSDQTFSISAQYILIAPKFNEVLLSHSFPVQKVSPSPISSKDTSSLIASKIYNLLNNETGKLKTVHDSIRESSASRVLFSMSGKVSLSEMFEVKNFLEKQFSDLNLSVELKNFSSTDANLFIRTKVTESYFLGLLTQTGKWPLNEQKILLFNPDDKSFAIISKEQNN